MRQLHIENEIDFILGPRLWLRFYADSRPHVLQTARLQKGAIIVYDGKELVEEGIGIGVPVCRYRDGTRFSLHAETLVDDSKTNPTLVKIYDMNGLASKTFRGATIERGSGLARLLKVLEKGYRGLYRFTSEASITLDVLSMLGMRSEYLAARSKGRISVSYRRSARGIEIKAALDELSRDGLWSITFANEVGGTLFNEYEDSTGVKLHAEQIEPWRTTQAEWASLRSRESGVGFKLRRPSGWLIVRGREVVRDRISWSGLDLLCEGTPQALEYLVEIHGAGPH